MSDCSLISWRNKWVKSATSADSNHSTNVILSLCTKHTDNYHFLTHFLVWTQTFAHKDYFKCSDFVVRNKNSKSGT